MTTNIGKMIEELRTSASAASDLEQVALCDRALDGLDLKAFDACVSVLREAEIAKVDVAEWCRAAKPGDYLAKYWPGEKDPGTRCGWSDSALADIMKRLRALDLMLVADDVGLRVTREDVRKAWDEWHEECDECEWDSHKVQS